jgi:tetratricopeptide (TPR) repeat protein
MIPGRLRPLILLLLLAPATEAVAQDTLRAPVPGVIGSPTRTSRGTFEIRIPGEVPLSRAPVQPLTGDQLRRIRRAQVFTSSGNFRSARGVLDTLLSEVPHHPLVLSELARTHIAAGEWSAVERLAKAERAEQKDSLLLGREYVQALEAMKRPRDAAAVTLEVWASAPGLSEWGRSTLQRLAALDARGVRDVTRKTVERLPTRSDIALALALIEWRLGDLENALRTLSKSDDPASPSPRWAFADEVFNRYTARDSTAGIEALLAQAGDVRRVANDRIRAGRRVFSLADTRTDRDAIVTRLYRALRDVPAESWGTDFLVAMGRALREAGEGDQARELLARASDVGSPTIALERALGELRDGPPERALGTLSALASTSIEGKFRYGEALFFAGQADTAKAVLEEVSKVYDSPFAGAALDRIYQIEETPPPVIPAVGRQAWLEWRGDRKEALLIADSLWHGLDPGTTWARAALDVSRLREAEGDLPGALLPAQEVAKTLPEDRLAPLARQRAGDLHLKMGNATAAVTEYEECLTRYPRAWNAAEVRRKLEQLRRERRF